MNMEKSKAGKILQGEVVSRRMVKTVVVKVTARKRHPKYFKQYSVSRRYKAHDDKGECQEGDMVLIAETRPLSKEKHWLVIGKIGKTV